MIKVLAICKSNKFIGSFTPYLNKHQIDVVSVISDTSAISDLLKGIEYDVILMDINWHYNPLSYSDLTRLIYDQNPIAKIIGFNTHFEEMAVERIRKAGAKGYFPRTVDHFETIVTCICMVNSGETYFYSMTESK